MTYSEVAASWKNKKLKSVVSLDQTLSDFRIIFADHSGVIENPEIYVVADYQGALPEEVPGEIENLCYEIGNMEDKEDNIFKAAAYLHCKFENIHLFADGNGRVGRTLINYFLMIHNYPPFVVYNETKDKYYHVLRYYDDTGNSKPFMDYMIQSLEKTWGHRTV